ncbi:MAG: hypothetical protein DRQ55_07005 [Planctomycetota bacterium]|nr:MAG: hypothetical protein DRQ55_07005 [Planctomycetota bacterium]
MLLGLVGASRAAAQEPEPHALLETAARLELRHGKKATTGSKAERRLVPSVRAALNAWAEPAEALGLRVAVGHQAEALVLGRCDEKLLMQATRWLDEAWELLEPVHAEEQGWNDAVVILLFDREGVASEAWPGVLDVFVQRGQLVASGAEQLKLDPGSLTLRDVPAFLQTTYDMAGDAAAGDDEFRLGNELVHKFAQCLVTERFGQVPDTLRWGMGYVVEQRLFRSIYQFDGSGFVSSGSHHDWPKRTSKTLKGHAKDKGFSLVELARDGRGGQAETPQMVTWATLDYLLNKDPEDLAGLLGELGELHSAAAGWRGTTGYAGSEDGTRRVLAEHLSSINSKLLVKHLKRVK